MPVKNSSEQGQVLVIIVLSLVVLFGFAALAIDGGMIYSDRRHAQNASDAASLAGGSAGALSLENDHVTYGAWNCGNSNVQDALDDAVVASISRAGDNDFSIDDGIDDFHGATANCGSGFTAPDRKFPSCNHPYLDHHADSFCSLHLLWKAAGAGTSH